MLQTRSEKAFIEAHSIHNARRIERLWGDVGKVASTSIQGLVVVAGKKLKKMAKNSKSRFEAYLKNYNKRKYSKRIWSR
jgi:hypothetical protein